MDYFINRYYSSTMGRFTSVDPTLNSMDVTNPQTFNRYTYALNNPLAFIDPDGLEPVKVLTWDQLTGEQKRLFQTYVQANYADQVKSGAVTAESLWDTSAAVANGDAQFDPNSPGLLSQSQLTTFAGVTSMLEKRGAIGEVASVTQINGEEVKGHEFRVIGELKNSTTSVAAIEKAFSHDKLPGKGHDPYTISRREQGLLGEPNGQVSRIPKGTGVDIDVDYRRILGRGHLSPENSDIRADDGSTSHYSRHRRRYGPVSVLYGARTDGGIGAKKRR